MDAVNGPPRFGMDAPGTRATTRRGQLVASLALCGSLALPSSALASEQAPGASPVDRVFRGPAAVRQPARETPKTKAAVPSPREARWTEHLDVAVGLAPEAAGSAAERAKVEQLWASVERSIDPSTVARRLRPGAGSPREVCRQGGHDLVIMVGYVPEREDPVVLSHDCRLDVGLGIRGIVAVEQPGLVGALWSEHDALVRQGMKERRRLLLGPRARLGIVATVGVLVLGGAIAALIATRFRDEKVVLTVSPDR